LKEQGHWDAIHITSTHWDAYPILRFSEVAKVPLSPDILSKAALAC
jgi:hypothetical protein